ncbi:MAG: hypothetical protein M0035_04445 [Actinomycetota bacterium]|nr:hypothetical protein [Actinomycetota bacterium]
MAESEYAHQTLIVVDPERAPLVRTAFELYARGEWTIERLCRRRRVGRPHLRWQEVMNLALRFSTRCATAYRRGGERTRRLSNAAVLDEVHVRDGQVVEAAYKEPFDLLFSSPIRIRRCGGP